MEKLIEISLKILFWITVGFVALYLPRIIGWFGALRPQKRLTNDKKSRLALLVPARNESLAIGDLLRAIGEQDYDPDFFDVHVIVKEPDDPTIGMAEKIGADVHVVPEQTCKGDALDGALKTILADGEKYDAYLIIDADCALAPDFLSRMNDAMASGADVICAKKLVKNHLPAKKGTSNIWTDCNGVIWTLIDDMGNRFKSDHGITCMTVGTGLLLRGSLIEKLGGWPYRETLTEDIELMYDCAANDYSTYYTSYAKCYVEESPIHSMTNKRRWRWMHGVVASRRLYRKKLRQGGNLKNRYYTTALGLTYLYMGICTAYFAFFACASLFTALAGNPMWYRMLIPAAAGFGAIYLSFFLMTACALIVERKNLPYKFFHRLAVLFVHPLFYMEYIRIVGDALLFKKERRGWEVIERVEVPEEAHV
jgi:glycosyltransferases, probably involved in cell wall biogenesis